MVLLIVPNAPLVKAIHRVIYVTTRRTAPNVQLVIPITTIVIFVMDLGIAMNARHVTQMLVIVM